MWAWPSLRPCWGLRGSAATAIHPPPNEWKIKYPCRDWHFSVTLLQSRTGSSRRPAPTVLSWPRLSCRRWADPRGRAFSSFWSLTGLYWSEDVHITRCHFNVTTYSQNPLTSNSAKISVISKSQKHSWQLESCVNFDYICLFNQEVTILGPFLSIGIQPSGITSKPTCEAQIHLWRILDQLIRPFWKVKKYSSSKLNIVRVVKSLAYC